MKLSQRLKEVGHEAPPPPGGAAGWRPGQPDTSGQTAEALHDPNETGDPLDSLKSRVQDALFNRLGARLYDASLSDEQLRELVHGELNAVLEEEQLPLKADERQHIVHVVSDDVLGYGPMERFLNDPSVTEVMVNSTENIYIEREGKLVATDARFTSEGQLRRVIERVVSKVGRRIDESSPMVDARLPDGSRVNAIIPPLAVDGPSVTIRKFASGGYTVDNLISFRTLTPQLSDFLSSCVRGKLNVLVSGGTGSG